MIDMGIDDKLVEVFFEDTNEMLKESINKIIDIEKEYDEKKLQDIMRNLHSIKGSSGMLELKAIENFSHNLETFLVKIKKKEIKVNSKTIDFLINSLNFFKEKIDIRYNIFIKDEKKFNKEMEEEKSEIEKIIERGKGIFETKKKEEKKYRIEIYLKKSLEMIGAKRIYIKKKLEERGKIVKSIPKEENLYKEEKKYYKFIYKTNNLKKEIINSINTTDINFILISESENLEKLDMEAEIYIQEDIKIENIDEFYEQILEISKTCKLKKVNLCKREIDIYGIQMLESLKKGGVLIEGEY